MRMIYRPMCVLFSNYACIVFQLEGNIYEVNKTRSFLLHACDPMRVTLC
jgi:hypothetical protein